MSASDPLRTLGATVLLETLAPSVEALKIALSLSYFLGRTIGHLALKLTVARDQFVESPQLGIRKDSAHR
jgi:hypothetical protein